MNPDRITLTGIQVSARHGVYAEEKVTPQLFLIDVTCRLASPARADDLSTTVDYAELAEQITEVATADSVDLIETLAERVAAVCLADPKITEVEVTVHKPQASMPVVVADIAVTITRRSSNAG
ncbi:MAG TPA: dihydroneopterin aldolase [Propionicimonas sp.]|nr:dihydroneopterin aldolase [Propionicimonas sp.]HRA06443.1 dihydroneopterin aldolase [Propionicimonas sp.]